MDNLSKADRCKNMQNIRSKNTSPEIAVRHALFALGYRYRIYSTNLPGKPDIVLPKYHAVIFVHGCFWHGHDGCPHFKMPQTNREYWTTKIGKNRKRDGETLNRLHALGWRICIVWECALTGKDKKAKAAHSVEKIASWLKSDNVWLEVSSLVNSEAVSEFTERIPRAMEGAEKQGKARSGRGSAGEGHEADSRGHVFLANQKEETHYHVEGI